MLRKFTKDIGRYRTGATHDYPFSTWRKLATDAKQELESFTEEIDHNPTLRSTLKGPVFDRDARSGGRLKLKARPTH